MPDIPTPHREPVFVQPPIPVLSGIYISGPMTFWPDLNEEIFNAAGQSLTACGYSVINPARFKIPEATWADYMRLNLADVLTCEGVCVLPHWQTSRGARLEVDLAIGLGIPVLPLEAWVSRTSLSV